MEKTGFTLIELILVIIIIGVIAVLGIPHYHKTQGIAREKAILTALEIIHNANELYLARHGDYFINAEGQITDLAYINRNLGTDIVMDPGISFTYSANPDTQPASYVVLVTYGAVTIALTQEPLTTAPADANPNCGNCYFIPARAT